MEKWETRIKLKLPGKLFKRNVLFTFEWAAWMIAYDHMNCGLNDFHELPPEVQVNAVSYGAAVWAATKRGRSAGFTYDDIVSALMHATRGENMQIGEAMQYAKQPKWMQAKQAKESDAEEKKS
ncbi:MAG: hypothetical protein U9R01_01365 [candidate division WOR-3 bacterium]|nr:hypothetical protein [candidate division WOR-3 bacterium]